MLCIETGGPTPGLGCAGRGIITTFSLLEDLKLFEKYKPDVVLYEEGLDDKTVTEAVREISQCDTLIIAGTSLTVYPAAGMVRYFQGDNLVLINRDKTSMDGSCDLVIHDKVGETLDKIVIK